MRLLEGRFIAYKNFVQLIVKVLLINSLSPLAYAEAFYDSDAYGQSSYKKSKQESRMDLAYDAAQKGLRHSDKFPGFAKAC